MAQPSDGDDEEDRCGHQDYGSCRSTGDLGAEHQEYGDDEDPLGGSHYHGPAESSQQQRKALAGRSPKPIKEAVFDVTG